MMLKRLCQAKWKNLWKITTILLLEASKKPGMFCKKMSNAVEQCRTRTGLLSMVLVKTQYLILVAKLKLQIVERMSNNLTTFIKTDVSPHSRPTFWIILTWQSDAELELAFWSFWESSLVVAKPELWKKEIHMLRNFFHLKSNLYMKKKIKTKNQNLSPNRSEFFCKMVVFRPFPTETFFMLI